MLSIDQYVEAATGNPIIDLIKAADAALDAYRWADHNLRGARDQFVQTTEDFSGDPSRIRTCNPRSRNPLLYPVELWDHPATRSRGLHSTANMKNPHPRQARPEPFSPRRAQRHPGIRPPV
jgi:hypothetical protein